jgi:hypothetical protein
MVTPQTVRRVVLTGSIAAITLTGTIYGAQLKSDLQTQQVQFSSSAFLFSHMRSFVYM